MKSLAVVRVIQQGTEIKMPLFMTLYHSVTLVCVEFNDKINT